jgi:hypothetical protein
VNQLTLAKASSSLAIGDCIVVKRDMLEVSMNTSVNKDTMMRMPRVLDNGARDCVSFASVKVLEVSEFASSGDRSDGVTVSESIPKVREIKSCLYTLLSKEELVQLREGGVDAFRNCWSILSSLLTRSEMR